MKGGCISDAEFIYLFTYLQNQKTWLLLINHNTVHRYLTKSIMHLNDHGVACWNAGCYRGLFDSSSSPSSYYLVMFSLESANPFQVLSMERLDGGRCPSFFSLHTFNPVVPVGIISALVLYFRTSSSFLNNKIKLQLFQPQPHNATLWFPPRQPVPAHQVPYP